MNCRNISVGRELDWKFKSPWFDPGFRDLYLFFLYALASRKLSTALFVDLNGVCHAAPLKVSNALLFHLTFWHQCDRKVACHCYMTVGCRKTRLHEVWTGAFLDPQKNVFLGNAGIDPNTYSMLPIDQIPQLFGISARSNQECPVLSGYALGWLVSLRASTCRGSVHLNNCTQ